MNNVPFKKRSLSFVFLVSACSGLYADDHANTNAACPHPQSVVEKDSFSYFSSKQSDSSAIPAQNKAHYNQWVGVELDSTAPGVYR